MDTLVGLGGADTFFTHGGGTDVVTDFSRSDDDHVQIQAGLTFQTTQVGPDVHIDLSGGGTMILQNQDLSSLGATSAWIISA